MIRCDDIPRLLEFFKRDPVRYRHILHELDSPCPAWDVAMRCCDYVDRVGFVLRQQPREPDRAATYYVNSPDDRSLVVRQSGRSARVEGRFNKQTCQDFVHWCRNGGIELVETWNESLRDGLTAGAGLGPWNTDSAQYTTGAEEFRAYLDARVRRLTCQDEGIWRRFADRNANDPMVNARPGSQAVIRDFVFMPMEDEDSRAAPTGLSERISRRWIVSISRT
jgi:hypothetical protein